MQQRRLLGLLLSIASESLQRVSSQVLLRTLASSWRRTISFRRCSFLGTGCLVVLRWLASAVSASAVEVISWLCLNFLKQSISSDLASVWVGDSSKPNRGADGLVQHAAERCLEMMARMVEASGPVFPDRAMRSTLLCKR